MILTSRQHRSKFAVFAFVSTGMLVLPAADKAPDDPGIDAAQAACHIWAVFTSRLSFSGLRNVLAAAARATRVLPGRPVLGLFDTISADVTSEHGKEVYSNIVRDGKPLSELPAGGAWSSGEFASELQAFLPPERNASFTHKRSEKIDGRAAWRYEFAVDAAHSEWRMAADHLPGEPAAQTLAPAFGGEIWIDSETGQILKIRMAARGLPEWFALGAVQSNTEYGFVRIGPQDYVLPTHSVSVTCTRGIVCLKNETTFRDYDKFHGRLERYVRWSRK